MITRFGVVVENYTHEILLNRSGDTESGSNRSGVVYDLPGDQIDGIAPTDQDWRVLEESQGIEIVDPQPIGRLALACSGEVERTSVLLYSANLQSLTSVRYGPDGKWLFANLRSNRPGALGHIAIGPFATKLRWALQNNEILL